MSESQDDIANLKPLYEARLAEDLERNAQEQERLSGEVAALQERLETLRRNQLLLANMQKALGDTRGADEAASSGGLKPSLPHQTQETPPQVDEATAGRLGAATPKEPAAPARSARAGTGGRSAPTLRDLVVSYLAQEGEPRSALDVTEALTQAHQDRGIKMTVVRSTLEAMVAKGQVRRSKDGRSVFYSATASSTTAERPVTA